MAISEMKILFVHQKLMSFVEKDLEFLKSRHKVEEFNFKGIRDLPFLIINIFQYDFIFLWFGKLHAFFGILFSKLLGKQSIVIAGGDDVAKQTATGRPYGLFSSPFKKIFGDFIFKYADLAISVSNYNYAEVIENTPATADRTAMIYHGFDPDTFYCKNGHKKEMIVATIGHISYENCWRKGFELIKKTARLMPDLKFYIIGPADDSSIYDFMNTKPDNLLLTGGLYGEDLVEILSSTSVYLQVSEWESFGCALAEAMLCECVPVIFNGTALPEVVGDCGYYIDRLDPEELSGKIRTALGNMSMGQRARQRIINEFPMEKRRNGLLKAVNNLYDRASSETFMIGRLMKHPVTMFAAVFILSFTFYYATLCPTITWGDPAKLAEFSNTLLLKHWGAAHPLHNLIGHLWGLIPFKDYAFGQNLLSAVFASLTVSIVFIIMYRITRSIWSSCCAAAVLSVSHTFWWLSVINESYSLLFCLLALSILFSILWKEKKMNRYLFFTSLFLGLGITDHYIASIFIPAFILYFIMEKPEIVKDWKAFCMLLLGGLLGCTLLIFILYKDNIGVTVFAESLLKGETNAYYRDAGKLLTESIKYAAYLFVQFPVVGFVIGICGAFQLYRKDVRLFLFLLLLFISDVIFSAGYMFERQFNLMVPSYIIFSIWIGIGFGQIADYLYNRQNFRLAASSLIIVMIATPLLIFYSIPPVISKLGINPLQIRSLPYRDNNHYFYLPDKRGYFGARQFGEEALKVADRNSVIIGDFTPIAVLKYLQSVEEQRKDIHLLSIDSPGVTVGPLELDLVDQMITAGKSVYICDKDDYKNIYNTDQIETMYNIVPAGPIYKLLHKLSG